VKSIVYLLDLVTPYAPQPILRANFPQILTLLAPRLLEEDADAPLLRPSIGCLEALLLAQDSAAWGLSDAEIGPRRAVAGLLNLSLDHRPKVRKRALEALKTVLASPPPTPSLDHPAAGMCAETAIDSLRGLSEKAALIRKNKRAAESTNDPALIHALQLVKAIAAASGGWPSSRLERLCELLLDIARSGNDHLVRAVFDIFEMIFEGMADATASSKLPWLLEIITELRPPQTDTQLLPPWIAILSRVYDVSAQFDPDDTFYKLPDVFATVSQYLESPSHSIRTSASECLVSFLVNCVPSRILLDLSVYDEKVILKLVKTVENLLSARYQAAWPEVFNVLSACYESLRWRAHPYLSDATKCVGDLRAEEAFGGRKEADEVLGKAIRAMGPAAVLEILPLNLERPTKTQPGRAWMLPLLRDFVANADLAHFKTELVPLGELMMRRALDLGAKDKTVESKIYETVVQQIWSILPGYCDLPLDLRVALDTPFAELISNMMYQHVELRLDICRALRMLVDSNRAISSCEEEEEDLVLQSRVSRDEAKRNIEHLSSFAGNFLAVLFNVYGQSMARTRGPVLQTINALLSITPMPALVGTFDSVCKFLGDSLAEPVAQQGTGTSQPPGEQMPPSRQSLLDLLIAMSLHLPRESFAALFEVAATVVSRNDDPQLQKKAYKLIPRIAESSVGREALEERHDELYQLLLRTADEVSAPARRERLGAIAALLPLIPDSSLHFIPSMLPEVVICCKEQNERARTAAFDILVLMGQRMKSAQGLLIDNSRVPHLPDDAAAVEASIEEYFTMVSAGLAGSTSHTISASITAMTRILYEFRADLDAQVLTDLVQTMDLFLTSNNREVVRSVLGFIKLCTVSLPLDLMLPRLPSLLPNLMLWSHEHHSRFRTKIKHLLDRMIRRFGFDTVNQYCPEADRKLIVNIRKSKDRNKRRKAAAVEADGESGEEERQDRRRAGRFESEYDQALYSSDESDEAGGSDDADQAVRMKAEGRRGRGGKTYILEEEDDPLDLLDRKALANISSTRPEKTRKLAPRKTRLDTDGKLILGEETNAEVAMDVDPAEREDTGVGAYVAALRGKNVPKRGQRGRLRWSNKAKDAEEDEGSDEEGGNHKTSSARADHGRLSSQSQAHRGRGRAGGRGGKGFIRGRRPGLGEEKKRAPALAGRVGKPAQKPRR